MTVWTAAIPVVQKTTRTRKPALIVLAYAAPTAAFLLVLAVLALRDLQPDVIWDVMTPYHDWAAEWFRSGRLVGIDGPWVYPILALIPMLAAGLAGDHNYVTSWLFIVCSLDMIVFVPLLLRSRRAAWWWLIFTACLGPIALGRIDAVALPLAIAGVLLLVRHPAIAAVLMTLGAWVKIWPVALLIALLATSRRRVPVVVAITITCTVIIGTALALGSGMNILSAGTMQAGRGIQIEAPIALPWMWLAHFRPDLAATYLDTSILTYQVKGSGTPLASALMNPILGISVIILAVLALRAHRAGQDPVVVAATAGIGLVAALVAFNKVGSPQYITWFAAPIILGVMSGAKAFRWPAGAVLVMAGLTQIIYPTDYGSIIGTTPSALVLLTVRNLLEIALVLWAAKSLLEGSRILSALRRRRRQVGVWAVSWKEALGGEIPQGSPRRRG